MRFSIVLAAAAPLLVNAAPVMVTRAASNTTIAVLKFAELLEQLEAQFYTQALQKFVAQDFIDAGISVPDVAIQGFQDILSHESAHVGVLDGALRDNGGAPLSGCSFNFDPVLTDVATMASVARVVEHVGVGAYLGGADLIDDKDFLAAAATILTVEARHQSFLNIIAGATAIPQAFDIALTPSDVLSIAGAFITGCDPATEIGLPPGNPPLALTNSGPITPGTLLQFSSPALNSTSQSTVSCQMLVGGQANSLSFPIDQCVVPGGINGPVWIYLTNDPQPLAIDIHIRASVNIIAGPIAAFLDTQSDPLGALVRTGGSGFNSSQVISPSQAQTQLANATILPPTGITDVPTNAAPTPDPNVVPPTGITDVPANAAPTPGPNSPVTSAPTLANATAVPPLSVLGFSSVPASSASA